jgi:serine/threonine-protein phosphatase 6 regulatory ankyrin repeat subunit B
MYRARVFSVLCIIVFLLHLSPACASDSDRLFEAISNGDLKTVKDLVTKNPKLLKATGATGQNPLSEAAYFGKNDIMAFLVSKGADVKARDSDGNTALHCAAHWGAQYADKNTVSILLSKGADINAKNNDGETPLLKSVTLMDRGIVNKRMAEILIKNGASIDIADKNGVTPLLYVVTDGQDDGNNVARFLISKGASVKVKGLLLAAASHSDKSQDRTFVSFLIQKGANVNEKDDNGATPLHMAARQGNSGIAGILISKGAKVREKDKKGKMPLDYADSNDKVMRDLLRKYSGGN